MTINVSDRLAIHELLALYGHIIDDRQFQRLSEIFTNDAVFDLSLYGGTSYVGLDAIIKLMEDTNEHPLAHHASNIVISIENEVVSVISKGIGVGYKGRVGSVVYRDVLEKVDSGWLIKHRSVELRKPLTGDTQD